VFVHISWQLIYFIWTKIKLNWRGLYNYLTSLKGKHMLIDQALLERMLNCVDYLRSKKEPFPQDADSLYYLLVKEG
jgi:hypothetical protein